MTEESARPQTAWASGEAYERYVGRWSRAVAREFIPWLEIPSSRLWMDVGCGTGALTEEILLNAAPRAITCIDRSQAFVLQAARGTAGQRATFAVADAMRLPRASESVDVAVSGLVINFVPRPAEALSEMQRLVRRGGTVAVYLWDYAGKMEFMRYFWDAAAELDPQAAELDEGPMFPICRPGALEDHFLRAGLAQVKVRPIEIPTHFRSFDDFWSPFLGGQGPAPSYAMSLEESRRVQLRDRLRSTLPVQADGSIALVARAWAARGLRT